MQTHFETLLKRTVSATQRRLPFVVPGIAFTLGPLIDSTAVRLPSLLASK